MLTAFYSIRLINLAFFSPAQGDKSTFSKAHEPGLSMSLPLLLLGFASIFIGFLMKDIVIGPGSPFIEFQGGIGHHSIESEFIPTAIK